METTAIHTGEITMIALENLKPGRFNPRKHFDENAISELSESIRRQGILQPIGVRKIDGSDNNYEIVYGERRFRASKEADLMKIPAIVLQITDDEAQEMAVTENLQRKDVTPIEEALAYRNLLDMGSYTVQSLAERFGKSENYIRIRLKFASLIPEIAALLNSDEITVSLANEICHYSEDIQKDVYERHLKGNTGYGNWRGLKTQEIATYLQNYYTTDLEQYLFDKTQCASCPENTNNLLLFCDGSCGKCANRNCLEEKLTSFIVEKAIDIMKQHPAITLCHYEYNYNSTAVDKLMAMGYEVEAKSSGLISFPDQPESPSRENYDTTEEYDKDYAEYEQELKEFTDVIGEINSKIQCGQLSLYARIGAKDITLYYAEPAVSGDNAQMQDSPLAKLEKKDKRNKEIALEKTIEDAKKQLLKTDMTETKFSAEEEKMLYFLLASSLRTESFPIVGLDSDHSPYLTDKEKLDIVSNLSAKAKSAIRRDFLLSKFRESCISDTVKSLLLDFARKHMPEELANIQQTHNEVYEKRHKRIEERKAALKPADPQEPAQNPGIPASDTSSPHPSANPHPKESAA